METDTATETVASSDTAIMMTGALAGALPYLLVGLVLIAVLVVVGGLWNRHVQEAGIGWQFIRYSMLGIALPLVAILALVDKFSSEEAAIFGSAIGFLFGKSDDGPSKG